VPTSKAHQAATSVSKLSSGSHHGASSIPLFVRADFASATQTVLYGMSIVMGVAFLVAFTRLPRGKRAQAEA
jgi:hypothetical protein